MGKSKNKSIGNAFEYRIAKWFSDREGWNGLRNPLSGASEQINTSISKHDVRAWHNNLPIFLQIEAKKRSKVADEKRRNSIEIKKEWIDKLDFFKDEILVVATDRSDLYVFVPLKRFFQVLGRSYEVNYDQDQIYTGEKQFVFKREAVDSTPLKRYHLQWLEKDWIILMLDEFITLRETANIQDDLTLEEQIKRLSTLDSARNFEKIHLSDLDYKQKSLLYAKLDQLENGSHVNPIYHAQEQFWLDDAFIIVCPFCAKKITKKDL